MPQTVRQRLIQLSGLAHGTFKDHLLAINLTPTFVYSEIQEVTVQENINTVIDVIEQPKALIEVL